MANRQGTLIVADDLLFTLNGKYNINGFYTGDIYIPADPIVVPQLVFIFIAETDVSDPFKSLSFEIMLPGSNPIKSEPFPIAPLVEGGGRTRWFARWPQLVQNARLSPGHIEAKIIHEAGEILVGGPWIVLTQGAPQPGSQ
jgi:hypothetical protein